MNIRGALRTGLDIVAVLFIVALIIATVTLAKKVTDLERQNSVYTDAAAQLIIEQGKTAVLRKQVDDLGALLISKNGEWNAVQEQIATLQGQLDSAATQLSLSEGEKAKLQSALDLWSQAMTVELPEVITEKCDKLDLKCRAKIADLRVAKSSAALVGEFELWSVTPPKLLATSPLDIDVSRWWSAPVISEEQPKRRWLFGAGVGATSESWGIAGLAASPPWSPKIGRWHPLGKEGGRVWATGVIAESPCAAAGVAVGF